LLTAFFQKSFRRFGGRAEVKVRETGKQRFRSDYAVPALAGGGFYSGKS
jgi:hypothetical protein